MYKRDQSEGNVTSKVTVIRSGTETQHPGSSYVYNGSHETKTDMNTPFVFGRDRLLPATGPLSVSFTHPSSDFSHFFLSRSRWGGDFT